MPKKAGLYVDAQNMFMGGRSLGWLIDYQKLSDYIEKQFNVGLGIKSYYSPAGYEIDSKRRYLKDESGKYILNAKQQKFFRFLQGIGYRVVTHPLKLINGDPSKPKDKSDTYLVADAITEMTSLEVMFICGGDSDFEPLIIKAAAAGVEVRVLSFKKFISWEIKNLSVNKVNVHFTYLDNIMAEIKFEKTK